MTTYLTPTYLVGGAVRDRIMGIPVKDRDYVVVGSSPEEMIANGYKQVGADFPVFLSPDGEEYALARTETKVGNGYHGFKTDFSKEVTLEDDLFRRDLTINAIAMNPDTEEYIDPFNGMRDIENGVIRHVSDFFADDPVRVLRVARFAARYLGFTIATETVVLCRAMVKNGELNHLTAERVALEMTKALSERQPSIFFEVLNDFGALEILFPELHALIGQTQPVKWHAEGDSFVHTMMVVDEAAQRTSGVDVATRFAALVHDLGKGLTPKDKLPAHHGHEQAGVPLVHAMCDRLKLSSDFRDKGALTARFHGHIHKLMELKEKTILKIFIEGGGKNKLMDFYTLAIVANADHWGRISEDIDPNSAYRNPMMFIMMMQDVSKVKLSDFFSPDEIKVMSVQKIKDFIAREQMRAIKNVKMTERERN